MKNGFVYWHSLFYRLALRILYGKYFRIRYEAILKLLPEHASIVDVCCGDCYIAKVLLEKNISYLGVDLNPKFIKYAFKKGVMVELLDIKKDLIPSADYILIQGSLYQFMPDHRSIIDKLISAARKGVIISEPVKNMACSDNSFMMFLSKLLTRIDGKDFLCRFSKAELTGLFREYKVERIEEIAGGRELLGVISKKC